VCTNLNELADNSNASESNHIAALLNNLRKPKKQRIGIKVIIW